MVVVVGVVLFHVLVTVAIPAIIALVMVLVIVIASVVILVMVVALIAVDIDFEVFFSHFYRLKALGTGQCRAEIWGVMRILSNVIIRLPARYKSWALVFTHKLSAIERSIANKRRPQDSEALYTREK
jgi:hypothetical protein